MPSTTLRTTRLLLCVIIDFCLSSLSSLQRWELLVLSRLKWDVSTVTPLDFLELFLCRLPIENRKCHDISVEKVRKHAQAFISLAARGKCVEIGKPSGETYETLLHNGRVKRRDATRRRR